MPMFFKVPPMVLLLAGVCLAPGGSAQTPNNTPPRSAFSQIIDKPTGLNGYEEFVLAGDLVHGNQPLADATQEGSTLTVKRRALADPNVKRARALLRDGLNKGVSDPRTQLDENTLFPELALFRNLARMLAVEQYVFLSEGRVSEAINSLREGLQFGYAIQTDTALSGLVGIAVDSIVLNVLARHLDQLSLVDCDRLIRLVSDWMAAPSPVTSILQHERDLTMNLLMRSKQNTDTLRAVLSPPPNNNNAPSSLELESYISQHPTALPDLVDTSATLATTHYDRVLASLHLPPWQREEFPRPSTDTYAGKLVDALLADTGQIIDRYTTDQVNVQLLGVHAAIHLYKWENDRLPASLALLNIGRMAIDPFNGKPFGYLPAKDTYTLFSIGPYGRSQTDNQPTKERIPVTLPRKN
jgi:hypothetical protein